MIYAFTGKTGSGKTYSMVRLAYDYWRNGVDIYSNTILFFSPSIFDKIRDFIYLKIKGEPFRYGKIIYFQNITEILEAHDGLILFDEAQVLFNARSWESLPEEFQYKLQQHRKHKLDLFCTTQNMGTIDITYRRLVQVWWHHDRVFGFGNLTFGLFRSRLKDVDMLYNSVDDIAVADIGVSYFIIGSLCFWRRALYDTLYDIGFIRFKTVWQSIYNEKIMKFKSRWWIIPKKMSLNDAQKAYSSLSSSSRPSRSGYFSRS